MLWFLLNKCFTLVSRSREAAEFLSRARAHQAQIETNRFPHLEPEVKPLNIQTLQSGPSPPKEDKKLFTKSPTESPRSGTSTPSTSPSPTLSPPAEPRINISPTLVQELAGGQKVEVIDFVKVCTINVHAYNFVVDQFWSFRQVKPQISFGIRFQSGFRNADNEAWDVNKTCWHIFACVKKKERTSHILSLCVSSCVEI